MSEPTQEPTPEPVPDTAVGWLPGGTVALFGEGATAEETYDLLTVDVPAERWITALETARDRLGCTFFDWLSAVDEPGTGFRVCAHLAALPGGGAGTRRLLLRTTVPHDAPALPTAVGVYAGAAWHERETHEMFGIGFPGHPHLAPLLLPDAFEGHPLRKDFVLAARVAKAWPGAKEPGEAADGGPKRRQMLPPGVPDPNEWGPLKGQLPPAPARPARAPRAAGDRPVRRTRSVTEGSASQPEAAAPPRRADGSAGQAEGAAPARRARSASDGSASQVEGAAPPRRARSASDGSASQVEGAAPARRTRSASDGSASQAAEGAAPAPARRTRSAADGSAGQAGEPAPRRTRPAAAGSSDAPWHHARPAFEEEPEKPAAPEDSSEPPASPGAEAASAEPGAAPAAPEPPAEPATEAPGATGDVTGDVTGDATGDATGDGEPQNDTNPAGGDPA
ncbi:NADH-quinone oxidoreductase subunit C [Streptomyces roseoverticillatus]|uniref:NADH-quinone oxidoreductase subunit C n=1 Tax=Streptomyces roseoverticillatus TaxID=66429 RepID=UPI0033FA5F62